MILIMQNFLIANVFFYLRVYLLVSCLDISFVYEGDFNKMYII